MSKAEANDRLADIHRHFETFGVAYDTAIKHGAAEQHLLTAREAQMARAAARSPLGLLKYVRFMLGRVIHFGVRVVRAVLRRVKAVIFAVGAPIWLWLPFGFRQSIKRLLRRG